MAKRPKNIRFETRRSGQKSLFKKIAAVLAICAVLGFSVAAIVSIVRDGDEAFGEQVQTTRVRDSAKEQEKQIQMDANFLLFSENRDKDCIDFMWLVNVKLPERKFTVTYIDPALSAGDDTFDGIFRKSGETKLKQAVESEFGVTVDKYIFTNEMTFRAVVNYFGGATLTIPEQIVYKTDEMNLVLVKGRQNMKGETFYKYLRYAVLMGDAMAAERDEALEAILNSVFKQSNSGSGTKIFSKLSNTVTTDITIIDFSKAEKAVNLLMENGIKTLEIVPVAELTGELK